MAIQVRILTSDDAPAFWDLRLEALESEPQAFGSSADEHRAIGLEQAAERLRPHPEGAFVVGAFEAARLVGTVGFARDSRVKTRHKGVIWGVYVKPAYRRRGIARKLLCSALERAQSYPGLRLVHLAVAVTEQRAAQLYRSLGFKEFGLETEALKVGEAYVDQYWMALQLDGRGEAKI